MKQPTFYCLQFPILYLKMQSFKQFLTEASSTEVSTALETVLGVAYQAASSTGDQKKELIKLMKNRKWKSKFTKTESYWSVTSDLKKGIITDEDADNLLIFGNSVVTTVKKAGAHGDGKFAFQNNGKVTVDWAKWSGKQVIKYAKDGVTVKSATTKKDVSKTDIVLSGNKFSVKNADGAQLMSGKKGESIATVEAAANKAGLATDANINIVRSLNDLEGETTEGYYASMENLKSLWTNKKKEYNTVLKLAKAMQKELDDWESTPKDKRKQRWNPDNWKGPGELSKTGKPAVTKGMKKVLKKAAEMGVDNWIDSGMSTMMTEHNKKFMEEVETNLEDNAKKAKEYLKSAFSSNASFKNAFVYEAATGDQKFGPIVQRADYMLSWAPKDKIENFIVKAEYVGTSAAPANVIKKYANAMDVQVNWKSSSTSSHSGYNAYQGVRIGIKTAMEEAEKEQQAANEEYEHLSQQLNEGYLAEGAFWDKVKELASKFWGKIKEVWNEVVGIFKKVVEHIKDAAEHGARALSTALGIDMEVTDTLRNQSLKIRI